MPRASPRVSRIASLAAGLVLATVVPCAAHSSLAAPPEWRELAPGLDFARVRLAAADGAPSGGMTLLRVDAERWRLEPRHYRDEGLDGPVGIGEWLERTGAPAVFNAGYYYPDRRHIGLLLREGRNLGTGTHPKWKGLLVSDPLRPPGPPARILDLLAEEFSVEDPPYACAVQSLMILEDGGKRVPATERRASRTAVAQDRRGRILVAWAQGEHSLWELADVLHHAGLGIVRAMTMDGGREAQLAVETGGVSFRGVGGSVLGAAARTAEAGVPLPAVVAVLPRRP